MIAKKCFLRTVDVAEIFRVSPASVRRWVVEGKIVAYRTPGAGRLLIDPDTLAAKLQEVRPNTERDDD